MLLVALVLLAADLLLLLLLLLVGLALLTAFCFVLAFPGLTVLPADMLLLVALLVSGAARQVLVTAVLVLLAAGHGAGLVLF